VSGVPQATQAGVPSGLEVLQRGQTIIDPSLPISALALAGRAFGVTDFRSSL